MYRRGAFLLSLGLALCVLSARSQDAGKDETIKVETRLVSIPTIVSDRNGRYIPNLKQTDFTLFQDGVAQKIEFFAATEEPINVAVLIDTSQSTHGVFADIKSSARAFVKLLKPADRAMILSFESGTRVLSGLTSDHDQLVRGIDNAVLTTEGGSTAVRDSVYHVTFDSFRGLNGRKALIVFTDGKDNGSRMSTDRLLYELQETDALIYTVMFETSDAKVTQLTPPITGILGLLFPRTRIDPKERERVKRENEQAMQFLKSLSDTTAGRFYLSKNGGFKKTFGYIIDELRFQYRLGFYPADGVADNRLHNVKVTVARPKVLVRTRGSYRSLRP